MRILLLFAVVLLTACSPSPKEAGYQQVNNLGCSFGTGDAFRDFNQKNVNWDYYPKEELKMFTFGDYSVTGEQEKEGLKQLFRLSARGCYLEAIRKQSPGSFK